MPAFVIKASFKVSTFQKLGRLIEITTLKL